MTDPTHLTDNEPARHALASVLLAILERHGIDELDYIRSQSQLVKGSFENLNQTSSSPRALLMRACYEMAAKVIRASGDIPPR